MKTITSTEFEKITSDRGSTYGLLARLYKKEVDQQLLDQMAKMSLPEEVDAREIGEGYKRLKSYLAHVTARTLTDLAVDYARIFIGAGATGNRTYPYESVYTSPHRLVMQDARDQVVRLYRDEGLEAEEEFTEPEDHVALELEFMAYLCQKTTEALKDENNSGALGYLKKQTDFVQQHLMPWVPTFCNDVRRLAREDLYRAVAMITEGYLSMEQDLIGELMDEIEETRDHAR